MCFISNKVGVEAHNGEWIYDKINKLYPRSK